MTEKQNNAPPVGAIAELQRVLDRHLEVLTNAVTAIDRLADKYAAMETRISRIEKRLEDEATDGEVSENP